MLEQKRYQSIIEVIEYMKDDSAKVEPPSFDNLVGDFEKLKNVDPDEARSLVIKFLTRLARNPNSTP